MNTAADPRDALTALHQLVGRLGVIATTAEAVATGQFTNGTARRITNGFTFDDAAYCDLTLVRLADGPAGQQRWVLWGADWGEWNTQLFNDEEECWLAAGRERPGAPEWTGLRTADDLRRLGWSGSPLSMVAWFGGEQWDVAGRVHDRIAELADDGRSGVYPPIDPVTPWAHPALEYAAELIDTDAGALRRIAEEVCLRDERDSLPEERDAFPDVEAGTEGLTRAVLCWNAALTDEVATDRERLGQTLTAVATFVRVTPPTSERLDSGHAAAMQVRRLIGGPIPLAPRPGPVEVPAEAVAQIAADDAAARQSILDLIARWAEVAAAQSAAGVPWEQRHAWLDQYGLVWGEGSVLVRFVALDRDRIVAVRTNSAMVPPERVRRPHVARALSSLDRDNPPPDWAPYDLLMHVTGGGWIEALTWTVRGRWLPIWRRFMRPWAETRLEQLGTDDRPPSGAEYSPDSPGAAEARRITVSARAFLDGRGVLGLDAPPRYPDVPPAEPAARFVARDRVGSELTRRVRNHGIIWALCRLTGATWELPPIPPAGYDLIAGLTDTDPERLVEQGIARLPVPPALRHDQVAPHIAAARGLDEAAVDDAVRKVMHVLNAYSPGGAPTPNDPAGVLRRFVEWVGLPEDRAAMAESLDVIDATHAARIVW
ncbi:hypothetical protein [Kribbia dieselivorans]|uniref:hypothetical protein n=1 Tax=Kribbia dieselivorans TaxID=331526 RepID=UPI000838A849|nr:hypothetical protein [Kribbia dieselivorans]